MIKLKKLTTLLILLSTLGLSACSEDNSEIDYTDFLIEGTKLESNEAKPLEFELDQDPDHLITRLKLLGYYFRNRIGNDYDRWRGEEHVLWIIENKPDLLDNTGITFISLNKTLYPQAYARAKKIWLDHIAQDPDNTRIVSNAARFFMGEDRNLSEELWLRAQALEPENHYHYLWLAIVYLLGIDDLEPTEKISTAKKALQQSEKALTLIDEEIDKIFLLRQAATAALKAVSVEKVKAYTDQLLEIAENNKDHWDYDNAVFYSYQILGLQALRDSEIDQASAYLLKSVELPADKEDRSLEMSFELAEELLNQGQVDTVIDFLELCKKVKPHQVIYLKFLQSQIKNGEQPDFPSVL